MANDRRPEAPDHHAVQRSQGEPSTVQRDVAAPANNLSLPAPSLLGDARLNGRGNGVLRQAMVQRTQQAAGNQATRRLLQRQAAGRTAVAASGPVPVQRYDSFEHVHLGDKSGGAQTGLMILECHRRDLPQREGPVNTWPPNWQQFWAQANGDQKRAMTKGLTYGEIVALSGDFYENYAALSRAPLREVIDLVPLVRRVASTTELQNATGGRYLELAAQNEHHFSNTRPGQSNMETWRTMHGEAIQAAMRGDANTAWGMNATADHYLTDAFAAGHIRTPRSELMGSTTGNIQSKVLHDLDNENGVEVSNERGRKNGDKPWIAYGDDKMGESTDEQQNPNARNLQMVEEAVRRSKQDIVDALAQGARYKMPSPYSVEELIPKAVDPTKDRWTGRTPTYTETPDGPIRNADDYTMKRDQIIMDEGPGVIAGLFTDDDAVRDWVARQDPPAIGRQTAADKSRMINTLLSGYITEGDVAAIERIAATVPDDAEMATIRGQVQGGVNGMTSPFQWVRVTRALKMNKQAGNNPNAAGNGASDNGTTPGSPVVGNGGGVPSGTVQPPGASTAVTDGGSTDVPGGTAMTVDTDTPTVAQGIGEQPATPQQGDKDGTVPVVKLQPLTTVDAKMTAVQRPYTFGLVSGLKRDIAYKPGQVVTLTIVIYLDGKEYGVVGLPVVIDKYDAAALRVDGHIKGNWRIEAADLTLADGKSIYYAWSKNN